MRIVQLFKSIGVFAEISVSFDAEKAQELLEE